MHVQILFALFVAAALKGLIRGSVTLRTFAVCAGLVAGGLGLWWLGGVVRSTNWVEILPPVAMLRSLGVAVIVIAVAVRVGGKLFESVVMRGAFVLLAVYCMQSFIGFNL